MKKMSKKATALAGLGVLAVVGGTFAYYNQTVSLENPLNTGHYDNEVIEDYTPPTDDLKPGATIDKVVGAKNTGDYPVMVRIKMDEVWRNADGDIIDRHSSEGLTAFAAETGASGEFTAQQIDDEDGDVSNSAGGEDNSVVRKNLTSSSKWTYNVNDGYWYYNEVLYSGEETGNLLDSITLASNIDLGKYIQKDYYYVGTSGMSQGDVTDNMWAEYTVSRDDDGRVNGITVGGSAIDDENNDGFYDAIDMAISLGITDEQKLFRKNESLLDEDHTGYADANYTLTVTSQFVQATPDALTEAFGTEGSLTGLPQDIQDVINGIDLDDLDLNRQGTAGSQGNDGE
ncbi:MAG TPA: hypothetical protein IAB60_04965 [Candidatus Caccovicinus merdipullorum]|uniref:Camelysin metallo-endopeptidase n=1 Tax=Candidatus Caccovicinus merdipullorum TaxID=2840724 RepID=A0A9D1GHW4_9FIRM|nr:hypothetical protein [Candidatus Caccovicinus merdipullorum]